MLQVLQRLIGDLGFRTDVQAFLVLFGLILARLVAAIVMAPFLGGQAVPARAKVGLGVILAALLYPGISALETPPPMQPVLLVALLLKEIMIGAALGLLAQMVFYAVQMAGVLIDTQRGMSQMTFFAPQLPGNVSVLGIFQFQAALVLFLAMDGHLLFLRALHSSFRTLPAASFPPFPAGGLGVVEQMARISADTLVIALELSAPAMVALFLVDVCFGAIGKVAPQVQAHAESQPVKALVGLALVFLSAGFVLDRAQYHMAHTIRQTYEMIQGFR